MAFLKLSFTWDFYTTKVQLKGDTSQYVFVDSWNFLYRGGAIEGVYLQVNYTIRTDISIPLGCNSGVASFTNKAETFDFLYH